VILNFAEKIEDAGVEMDAELKYIFFLLNTFIQILRYVTIQYMIMVIVLLPKSYPTARCLEKRENMYRPGQF
jgi:hypothetical protein